MNVVYYITYDVYDIKHVVDSGASTQIKFGGDKNESWALGGCLSRVRGGGSAPVTISI